MDSPNSQKRKVWTYLVVFPFEVPGYQPEVFAKTISAEATQPSEAWNIIHAQMKDWLEDPQWVAEHLFDWKGLSDAAAKRAFEHGWIGEFIDLFPLWELAGKDGEWRCGDERDRAAEQ